MSGNRCDMSTTYRCQVRAKDGKTVEIDGGHRGMFVLGDGLRPIASDLLGLALYLEVVNHDDVEVTPSKEWPATPDSEWINGKVTVTSGELDKEVE